MNNVLPVFVVTEGHGVPRSQENGTASTIRCYKMSVINNQIYVYCNTRCINGCSFFTYHLPNWIIYFFSCPCSDPWTVYSYQSTLSLSVLFLCDQHVFFSSRGHSWLDRQSPVLLLKMGKYEMLIILNLLCQAGLWYIHLSVNCITINNCTYTRLLLLASPLVQHENRHWSLWRAVFFVRTRYFLII